MALRIMERGRTELLERGHQFAVSAIRTCHISFASVHPIAARGGARSDRQCGQAPRAPHPTLYGDFFVKWKSARLSLFGMGRGSARGPLLAVEVLAARTVDGPKPCQGRSRRRRWP